MRGGTNIEGGLTIIRKKLEEINSASNIEITVSRCEIKEVPSAMLIEKEGKNKGSVIDSGACTKSFLVYDSNNEKNEITLLSTRKTLTKIERNDVLFMLNEKE